MKSLKEFINERFEGYIHESNEKEKTFTFNFTDLEDSDDIIKSLEQYDFVTVNDKKIEITLSDAIKDKVDGFQDIVQQYCHQIRNSSSRTNNEAYAQKTLAFEKTVNEFNDFLDELLNPEEPEEDQKKEKDDKKSKEDETE